MHLLLFACCVATAAPDLELTWTGGLLGDAITYELVGDANEFAVLVPSVTAGPTPLAPFAPGDPKVLDVGLELDTLAVLVPLGATGSAQVVYRLPPSPALEGVVLRAQAVSIDLVAGFPPFDDLSPVAQSTLASPFSILPTATQPATARRGHSMARLPDGRVLIVGGEVTDAAGQASAVASWELYDPNDETFVRGSTPMPTARSRASATVLADGRVLVVGGARDVLRGGIPGASGPGAFFIDPGGPAVGSGPFSPVPGTWSFPGSPPTSAVEVLDSALLFLPGPDIFVAAPAMTFPRAAHSATLLQDGRVLVVGGRADTLDLRHSMGGDPASGLLPAATEIFDPLVGAWSAGPALPGGLIGHSATLLFDGRVVIAGGLTYQGGSAPTATASVFVFDPVTDSIAPGPPLPAARAFHGATEAADGGVFLAGGTETLSFAAGQAPGGEDLLTVNGSALQMMFLDPVATIWSPEIGPSNQESFDPQTHCVIGPSSCPEYVIIQCPDDDVTSTSGPLDIVFRTTEKCPSNPLIEIDFQSSTDGGSGHECVALEEIDRIVAVGAVAQPSTVPVSDGVVYAVP